MALYISNETALDPTENILFRRGRITRVNYADNLLDVVCDEDRFTRVPPFYACSKTGQHTVMAFALEDDVIVRFDKGFPTHVTGFYGSLWPCVPMPSFSIATDESVFSVSMFAETDFMESPGQLFDTRYQKISTDGCGVEMSRYINVTPPEDLSGVFAAVEQDGTTALFWYRDTEFYYDNKFIYRTYNEESKSDGAFNGTRSNILGTYINPDTKAGVMAYQVNTFTDWIPKVSGRVDFAFFVYSSSGFHEQVAGGYSIVTGSTSTAEGDGISSVSCVYSSLTETGHMLCLTSEISELSGFSADSSVNTVRFGDKRQEDYLCVFSESDTIRHRTLSFRTDSYGQMELPDGRYAYAEIGFYKKDR
ncbi:MAG: hypothetical protein AB7E96_01640 [Deferribacterales bacterium]